MSEGCRISRETLRHLVKRLPSPMVQVAQIVILIDNNASETAIEEAVSQDPALTAQVLRIANSPFFGTSRQVNSIGVACRLLGLAALRNIVIASGVVRVMPAVSGPQFETHTFWRHAQSTAVVAHYLAERVGGDAQLAFLGGLLHDLGHLVLASQFADAYAAVLGMVAEGTHDLSQAESEVFGMSHAEVAAHLFEYWRLPADLITLARYHHQPQKAPEPDIPLAAVHVGDVLVHRLLPSVWTLDIPEEGPDSGSLALLGLPTPIPAELLTEIVHRLEDIPLLVTGDE